MSDRSERLRVALVAGTLGQGGAEKQLVYMARALQQAGVDVRVYCLTRGEYHEAALRAIGLTPIWIGQSHNPAARVAALWTALRQFGPHIVQSAHFYTNLYTALAGRLLGTMSIGAIRNDTVQDIALNGRWGRFHLRVPPVLIANSHAAKRNAETLGINPDSLYVVPNVLDLPAFDEFTRQEADPPLQIEPPVAIAVSTLKAQKRLDRFLMALSMARRQLPNLKGVLVGHGRERGRIDQLAQELGLPHDELQLLGRRADVPALLRQATMLVLSSDHEGFPNVLLEAMAARLPVITTPAGDAGVIVQDGMTGYVLPFDDVAGMAERMIQLSSMPDLRTALGAAGRRRVEQLYSFDSLAEHLLSTYRSIAEKDPHRRLGSVLSP